VPLPLQWQEQLQLQAEGHSSRARMWQALAEAEAEGAGAGGQRRARPAALGAALLAAAASRCALLQARFAELPEQQQAEGAAAAVGRCLREAVGVERAGAC
jgi:hypothetical protein